MEGRKETEIRSADLSLLVHAARAGERREVEQWKQQRQRHHLRGFPTPRVRRGRTPAPRTARTHSCPSDRNRPTSTTTAPPSSKTETKSSCQAAPCVGPATIP